MNRVGLDSLSVGFRGSFRFGAKSDGSGASTGAGSDAFAGFSVLVALQAETSRETPGAHERKRHHGQVCKFEPHGVGLSRGVHPEVPTTNAIRAAEATPGRGIPQLATQKESRVEEGHLMSDHVHMMLAIPPKYAVSQVVGFIKAKSAIRLARMYGERKRNFVGQHFWARGYFVSTVGRDETVIRA